MRVIRPIINFAS